MKKREFKDSLFRFIYSRKENKKYLLSLYNALGGSNCTDENELEITTIENVIYISRKNDVSFLIESEMYLLEQQSTFNPNMPIRGLMYFSQLYSKRFAKSKHSLYKTTLVKIPAPNFYVFYNGTREMPDKEILRLSDAFNRPVEGFEWTAVMLNINYGHNKELLNACESLHDYALYVKIYRDKKAEGLSDEDAADAAVDEAIKLNLLDGFFKTHKAEVGKMILCEFDQEEYDDMRREEGRAEGREEMQPIIDQMTAEIAEKDRIIAELQTQIAQRV